VIAVAKHRAETDWYPQYYRAWTYGLAAEWTLLIAGTVLRSRALFIATLLIGFIFMLLGLPILNEHKHRTNNERSQG
jgi:hypothetical protein